jgi:hypothetical protein
MPWVRNVCVTVEDNSYCTYDPSEVTAVHERVHDKQQDRDGWKFYALYILSPWHRFIYEREAYRTNMHAGMSAKDVADTLHSPLYLWMWPVGRKKIEDWTRGEALRAENALAEIQLSMDEMEADGWGLNE